MRGQEKELIVSGETRNETGEMKGMVLSIHLTERTEDSEQVTPETLLRYHLKGMVPP